MREEPVFKAVYGRRWTIWAGVFALALVLVGVLAWAWFASGTDAYLVDGVPFHQWLAERPDFDIRDPLAELGTNAVPHLVQILRRTPESARTFQLKQKVWNWLPKSVQSRVPHLRPIPDWQVRRTALFAVRFLGPEAEGALPEVLWIARTETNRMVRASALVAALNIAPRSPQTFALWRDEWTRTNYFSRHDLAVYLRMPQVSIPAAVPYLLNEATNEHAQAVATVLDPFEFFGDAAQPALPDLIKLFRGNADVRLTLCRIFERLGPHASDAVPVLTACLQEPGPLNTTAYDTMSGGQVVIDQRPGLIIRTLGALGAIGPAATPALPAIAPFLTNSDPTIRLIAAAASLRVGGPANDSMRVLLAGLEDRLPGGSQVVLQVRSEDEIAGIATRGRDAAAILCGQVGPAAVDAMPSLKQLLDDKIPAVRISAAQAIWRITHQTKDALPALVAILDSIPQPNDRQGSSSEDYKLVLAIEAIAEMGPAAEPSIPSLQRVRTSSMTTRHAVNKAMGRIRPSANSR